MQGLSVPGERLMAMHWRGDDDFVQSRHKLDLVQYVSGTAAQLRALEASWQPGPQATRPLWPCATYLHAVT